VRLLDYGSIRNILHILTLSLFGNRRYLLDSACPQRLGWRVVWIFLQTAFVSVIFTGNSPTGAVCASNGQTREEAG
jgi:hypothetical protein